MTEIYEQEKELRTMLTEQEVPEALTEKVLEFRRTHALPEEVAARLRKPVMPFYGKEILIMAITGLLEGENLLFFLGFLLFSGKLISVLTVIDDLADRRLCCRGDLYQIEISLLCHLVRITGRHDSQLLSCRTHNANFSIANLFVNH